MIYLASPYNHPDPEVMETRFKQVCEFCGEQMLTGQHIYSPIVHNHPIAKLVNLPRTWQFWSEFDLAMLSLANQLWIYKLDGWGISKGVMEEIKFAVSFEIPITYITP